MQLPSKTQNGDIHSETSKTVKMKHRKRKVQDAIMENQIKRTKMIAMNKKRINFCSFPYVLQYSIFAKLTFKQFVQFEESGKYAHSLCENRRKMKFPHEIAKLQICGSYHKGDIKIDKFEKQLLFSEVGDQVQLSIKNCHTYLIGALSQERFDFYTQKVKYFEPYFCYLEPRQQKSITSLRLIYELKKEFPYDTSAIDKVNLVAPGVSCEVAFSLKAKLNLFVMSALITPQDILRQIQSILTKSATIPRKTFLLKQEIKFAELEEALKSLGHNCKRVKLDYPLLKDPRGWAIMKPDESEPYLELLFASETLITIGMWNYLD